MRLKRFIFLLLLALLIYFSLKVVLEKVFGTEQITSMEIAKIPVNCAIAKEKLRDKIDDLAIMLSGLEYNKKIAVCVEYNKIYCLGSKIIKINNISVIYFDTICYLQKNFNPKEYDLIIIPKSLILKNKSPDEIWKEGLKEGLIRCNSNLKEKLLEFFKE